MLVIDKLEYKKVLIPILDILCDKCSGKTLKTMVSCSDSNGTKSLVIINQEYNGYLYWNDSAISYICSGVKDIYDLINKVVLELLTRSMMKVTISDIREAASSYRKSSFSISLKLNINDPNDVTRFHNYARSGLITSHSKGLKQRIEAQDEVFSYDKMSTFVYLYYYLLSLKE